ncbi:MAG TPA: UDP-2,3-diacylglucosamine diphosphatase [Pyrinomonadaceae bacterium]|nr:UDP-2,3-diacylglucosamine diphosphatase [Pyrinomonadaceae bacterium]
MCSQENERTIEGFILTPTHSRKIQAGPLMTTYTPRFDFDRPRFEGLQPRHVRTIWISDVHLGTRASGAAALLDFLRKYDCETLYVVGDLFDIWQMRRGIYWPQQHNDVVQKILRKARKGTRVIYIPGNHDELISSFEGWYGNITVQKEAIHRTADGRRILVIHGHELDTVVQNVKWLAYLGDTGYQFLLSLNPLINSVRRRLGLGYWSLSAFAKHRVKDAVSFIGKFEAAVIKYAERYRVDGVLCGHIHKAAVHEFGRVVYYNCGDWVEGHTALIERFDGSVEVIRWTAPRVTTVPFAKPAVA